MSGKQQQKGEGSYEGTRQYDEATKRFVESHDIEKLGKKAKEAVENDDGTLADAEQAGKKPARR